MCHLYAASVAVWCTQTDPSPSLPLVDAMCLFGPRWDVKGGTTSGKRFILAPGKIPPPHVPHVGDENLEVELGEFHLQILGVGIRGFPPLLFPFFPFFLNPKKMESPPQPRHYWMDFKSKPMLPWEDIKKEK